MSIALARTVTRRSMPKECGGITTAPPSQLAKVLDQLWTGTGVNTLPESGSDVVDHSTFQQAGEKATAIDRRMEAHGFRADIDVILFRMRHDIKHGNRDFF